MFALVLALGYFVSVWVVFVLPSFWVRSNPAVELFIAGILRLLFTGEQF